jgi:NADPH-dependent glutamate synthase beta subunit-like oxidoreductase
MKRQHSMPGIAPGGPTLQIGVPGYTYADLYDPLRLRDLHDHFRTTLRLTDPTLADRYEQYLATQGAGMSDVEISAVIVDTAPHVAALVAELFQVRDEHGRMTRVVEDETVIFVFKREFVVRRALKRFRSVDEIDTAAARDAVDALMRGFADRFAGGDDEQSIASMVVWLMSLEKALRAAPVVEGTLAEDASALLDGASAASGGSTALAARIAGALDARDAGVAANALLELFDEWVAAEHYAPSPRARRWVSLATPHNVDFARLVELDVVDAMPTGTFMGPEATYRHRDGFALTDPRFDHREVLDQVHYCIFCHERDKDSCSKGLLEKDGSVKRNPLGIKLEGCPLDEKISEMHVLKSRGNGLAALATITIDNPLCAGTGHRICNDCMKSCIYQKQEPVNIPQAETGVLTEILRYPFGFEIYAFLTRWNPLNVKRPYPLPYNGKKLLVVGLGPAGYTLAHHMINEGFGVVGIDGLKIEPLPSWLTGTRDVAPTPIHDWDAIYEHLDERILLGFGGVSEYGITVRWDKNFLKVIYILLARRRTFKFYGGVRFGGTMTIDDAWRMGFDHVAIATGAGKPTIVPMKNNLARGVRQASDFLMALQLTGAAKSSSLANLQLRMPVLVIGGGLTAIDTATESMAYYPVLVERVLHRMSTLTAELGADAVRASLTDEDREILDEYIAHGEQIAAERAAAERDGRAPNFIPLLRSWGGVTLVYRKTMLDSPAYRLNHEEIIKALEEGIYFAESLSPVEIVDDRYGAAEAVVFERQAVDENGKWRGTSELVTLRARSIMVAAGTSPNTILDRESPQGFEYDEWQQFFAPFIAQTRTAEAAVEG